MLKFKIPTVTAAALQQRFGHKRILDGNGGYYHLLNAGSEPALFVYDGDVWGALREGGRLPQPLGVAVTEIEVVSMEYLLHCGFTRNGRIRNASCRLFFEGPRALEIYLQDAALWEEWSKTVPWPKRGLREWE